MTATNDLLKRIAFAVLGVSLIAYGLWIQSGEPTVATGARSASNKASAAATAAQPSLVKIPIKDMRVGTRVPAFNPEVSATERAGFREPNWYQWMKLRLEMPKPDGTLLEIEMLRSEEWLVQQMAVVVQPESIMLPSYSEPEFNADNASAVSEPSSLGSLAIATAKNAAATEATVTETTFTESRSSESRSSEARSSEATPSGGFGVPFRPIYYHLASLLSEAAAGGDEVLGLVVQLDLPELGLSGPAWIVDLDPAPIIPPGPGQVVTATFKHASANVLDLVLTNAPPSSQPTSQSTRTAAPYSQSPPPAAQTAIPTTLITSSSALGDSPTESIGVTFNHPFWSIDRAEFVQAGELTIGERLQTLAGDTVWVQQKLPRPGPEPVYNLEVHDEHVYYVGETGLLAHNSGNKYSNSNRKFRGPIHHIASDKDKLFLPEFKKLFERAGVDMQSPWNKMRVEGHVGPHGKYFNGLILDRLQTAVGTKTGAAARTALIDELKAIRRDIRYGGWDAFLKAPASWVDTMGKY
ncbi:MAG: polymorphic toxin-type HINT domain-containing protein [Pirellulaceae bacterium]|nr:polymorphic toxin-type HINT domain-containing protein [Pirellulaceae bacterium]